MQQHLVFKPLGETYRTTIGVTITSLPTIPDGALRCKLQVETQDIRARFNANSGSTYGVTSIVGGGFIFFVNTVANPYYLIEGIDEMSRMRMVQAGSTAGTINVMFEGEQEITSYNGGTA
jgi:hypothetical protein